MMVALIQLNAGTDKAANVRRAHSLTEEAARKGAELIVLPEVFFYRGPVQAFKDVAEAVDGPTFAAFSRLAKTYSTAILLGSVLEKGSPKYFNTSIFVGPDGESKGVYRKINLFDVVIGKQLVRESTIFNRGTERRIVEYKGFRIGLTICFDLRFPELYRSYGTDKVDLICVPSCFTKFTGQAHWEVLLRARAVENLCYIAAPNQFGKDYRGIASYGNSMLVDPWGKVLVRGSAHREEILYAKIHKGEIKKYREILPDLKVCQTC